MSRKIKESGVSLRSIQIWLIIGAILFSGLILFFTYYLSSGFQNFTEYSEQHIELRKAARELLDTSDYLSEQVQCFTINGEKRYMDEYFKEAFEQRHREEALQTMAEGSSNEAAVEKLKKANEGSVVLMEREYYAMRLVVEAKGYADYPDALKDVELTAQDKALSPQEKMHKASEWVHDDIYHARKDQIREDTQASLDELEQEALAADAEALASFRKQMLAVRSVIVLQTIGVIFLVWLASRLGIHPILDAVDRIKSNKYLEESGTSEFRYLVRAYNSMYKKYKHNLERLNFKASHDELTGVFNRSGYESILSNIDLDTTYMILFDVDDFKSINDTYGHETGDKILTRTAEVLKKSFRNDDYICRIGGDEFVVFMVHASEMEHDSLAAKIEAINRELGQAAEDMPAVSVSVGIVHGSEVSGTENLFEMTDEALYASKRKGKHTYTFL
ncbi:MAG: GGDEF domain-containing protein [Clostridia bacterium]|nr:GGDEF domain-containing protein [Clostridia bacterium]